MLQREEGWEEVTNRSCYACISAVNLSEIVANLAENKLPLDAIENALAGLNMDVRGFDETFAIAAGKLLMTTRNFGLSFGDLACPALAAELGIEALTTDRAWTKLDIDVPIRLVR